MAEILRISQSEWYFETCLKSELPVCLYYEYARSSPTMIKAINNVHEDILSGVTEVPRLKDVVFLTDLFPKTPWQEIPGVKRFQIINQICDRLPPDDLIYRQLETDVGNKYLRKSAFPEFGPVVRGLGNMTVALIEVHWDRGDTELKKAFELFLERHQPPGTGPTLGRGKRDLDYLNSLGAKRLLDHCTRPGVKNVAKAAFDLMKRQADESHRAIRQLFATASALTTAAKKVEDYLPDLYGVPIDRRLAANNVMSEEEANAFGPIKPWVSGIYLDDPPGFG